ncbi:hypothetical protein Ddye_024111 [Dipteronia dyeriana]|uniref:C-JID domain-containing protein n=1 Tax=Dipteronia dyeriana TaxID=168575 RepID=A0AAD9WTW2_9ROSI|nr:hypothetical protein Ddye_024111 [Dipteronia dyeriana]
MILTAQKNMLGAAVSFCFPGNEIPEWFSHQYRGSAVVVKLPPHWCSTKFLGFALCVVVAFKDCKYFDFSFNCKCYFLTKDGELYEIVCDLKGMQLDGRHGFLESDHVFLLYAHGLSAVVQRDDGEHNLSIYSSCQEALFEFSPVDKNLQPITNCKIEMCGVHLLYLEEETSDASCLNEAELVESGGDGISNVEAEEDANSKTLEEDTEHNSESEVDTILLGKSRVNLMSKKVLLIGLALFFLWWCLLSYSSKQSCVFFFLLGWREINGCVDVVLQ